MRQTRLLVPLAALLLAAVAARSPAPITRAYEVKLGFIGYTGLATSLDCDAKANQRGYDSLVGTVKGIEIPEEPDEDVVYTGTLKRSTNIDYCQTRGRRSPTDDEVVWCVATLTGSAAMEVEIKVYGDEGRGAWLTAKPRVGPVDSKVQGTCEPADMVEIQRDYPSGESAGSPDGQAIMETDTTQFVLNRVRRLRVGYFPPDPVQGGWGLRVVRAVP